MEVANAQREAVVDVASVATLARRAIRRLRIRTPGTLAIALIGSRQMRLLNKRFLRHDRVTDVLSFRYDGARRGQVVGEILVAPGMARRYAARHGIPYEDELARYIVHGLLHWHGLGDRTAAERRRMRAREDWLLAQCART